MFKHLFIYLLSFTLVPGLTLAQASQQHWQGTLDTGGPRLRLEVALVQNGEELSGELISLDQGKAKLKLSKVVLDDKTFAFSIPQIGAQFNGELNAKGDTAAGMYSQAGIDMPLTFSAFNKSNVAKNETLKEAWIGKLNINGMEPVMQFRVMTLNSGDTQVYFDSVTEGLTGFSGSMGVKENQIQFDIPSVQVSYSGTVDATGEVLEGWWKKGAMELPLQLRKHDKAFDNLNVWENRSQRPQKPFPYTEKEVAFTNTEDNVQLAGTLTIPKGKGPHPAVILISGSGPQDRDEFFMEHRPFLVLADYLTRQGIAVLRYDDRGTAQSTGVYAGSTVVDFARDASAAVDFLKTQKIIDPSRIGLAGHSEGGLVAPMVANQHQDVSFVVLMAATAVEGKAILLSQTEVLLQAQNTPMGERDMARKINKVILDTVANSDSDADMSSNVTGAVESIIQSLPEEQQELTRRQIRGQIPRLQGKWMRHFLNYDPATALRNLDTPVLAITGTKDLQVIPELNVPPMKAALAHNDRVTFVQFEGLNHLFQTADTGLMSEYAEIDETFNPKAMASIAAWILDRGITK